LIWGGTNLRAAVVTQDKKVLARDTTPTHAEKGPEAVMEAIREGVEDAVRAAGLERRDLLAVGIGAPGPMNWQTGVVYDPPNLPGWKNVPLADEMRKRLGVPCFVENDANVAGYGEFWLGAGQGTENMCILTLGTGLGGGIVTHGKLLRGVDGTAAEIGHLKVERNGRLCGCGGHGCLEQYASVTGLRRTAWSAIEAGRVTVLEEMSGGSFDGLTGKMIDEAADRGDEVAAWAMNETAVWLGLGIASLVNLLNPERVVLYGGLVAAGERILKPVREVVMKEAFEVPAKRAEIVVAALGEDAGVIGAAACALDRVQAA
jgi:glucokinase